MTICDEAHETMRIETRPAFAARVIGALSNLYRTWKNRRQFYRLGEMSDAELADIGLVRSDLHFVVDLPFGVDPTTHLNSIVRARTELSVEDMARRAH
ncbi:DUF1127 domain-containing protein [Pseudaminobacter arsenicus]|uniref:DUF1127 domain-containing protein n=1 Tax=Borborobacter arsenicus TaxID=1851146 RepID=A0A432VAD6_9HYPH|nr:DUF1127 domain-containing protein [Pseudaminobacter arsenicus]RUM99100.1 DUF1127 domain-containing protein [Pseudaminobacter arsenicus]